MKKFKAIKRFSVSSTQSEAEKYLGKYENFVVIARRQKNGRGRNGRSFASPLGGLYMSVHISCEKAAEDSTLFVLYAGLAVKNALSRQGIETTLKFPNDVKYKGKKLCGIISSSTISGRTVTGATIGIGINIKNKIPENLKDVATNLSDTKIKRKRLVSDIVSYLYEKIAKKEDKAALLAEYRLASETIGQEVTVDCVPKISGKAIDIDEKGFLLVENNGIIKRVSYGDVTRS